MKQYVVVAEEKGIQFLQENFMPGLFKFIEVQGMPLTGQNAYALVTPIVAPITPAVVNTTAPAESKVEKPPEVVGIEEIKY